MQLLLRSRKRCAKLIRSPKSWGNNDFVRSQNLRKSCNPNMLRFINHLHHEADNLEIISYALRHIETTFCPLVSHTWHFWTRRAPAIQKKLFVCTKKIDSIRILGATQRPLGIRLQGKSVSKGALRQHPRPLLKRLLLAHQYWNLFYLCII